MDREHVIATLRDHESELRAAGITHLSLFGSTARGDSRPDSDIDLLAAFDETRRISLLMVAGIERQLSQMLGATVELVEEGTLKPRVWKNVEAEALRAFQRSHPAIRRYSRKHSPYRGVYRWNGSGCFSR